MPKNVLLFCSERDMILINLPRLVSSVLKPCHRDDGPGSAVGRSGVVDLISLTPFSHPYPFLIQPCLPSFLFHAR